MRKFIFLALSLAILVDASAQKKKAAEAKPSHLPFMMQVS